jgi:hypothetical protein
MPRKTLATLNALQTTCLIATRWSERKRECRSRHSTLRGSAGWPEPTRSGIAQHSAARKGRRRFSRI